MIMVALLMMKFIVLSHSYFVVWNVISTSIFYVVHYHPPLNTSTTYTLWLLLIHSLSMVSTTTIVMPVKKKGTQNVVFIAVQIANMQLIYIAWLLRYANFTLINYTLDIYIFLLRKIRFMIWLLHFSHSTNIEYRAHLKIEEKLNFDVQQLWVKYFGTVIGCETLVSNKVF